MANNKEKRIYIVYLIEALVFVMISSIAFKLIFHLSMSEMFVASLLLLLAEILVIIPPRIFAVKKMNKIRILFYSLLSSVVFLILILLFILHFPIPPIKYYFIFSILILIYDFGIVLFSGKRKKNSN